MEQHIIRPAHNKPAAVCKSWRHICHEAERLRAYIKDGKFEGNYKNAFAISHAQVSHAPLHFFVINEQIEIKGLEKGQLKKWFGSWCVINAKIIETEDLVYFPDACMSFPYRKPKNTDRWNKITVEYFIPFLWGWRKVARKFKGLPSFIVQHENEHSLGKNIYGK